MSFEERRDIDRKTTLLLILLAYCFSFGMRLIWVYQFGEMDAFTWNNQLMINTNDGYYFASGVQQALSDLHLDNPRVPSMFDYGVVALTVLLVKITPLSLETVLLYLPAVISSLVVIPMILTARLYKQTAWGFFAALLGSITWSYYNRTMTGYYDTDMFSAMAPMFILYFLIKSTIDFDLRSSLYAALAIVLYPFLYDQGQSIVYTMGILYAFYMVFYHRQEPTTYASLILVFLALTPLGLAKPYLYLVQMALVFGVYLILKQKNFEVKKLMVVSAVLFIAFLSLGNVFGLILSKIVSYTIIGTQESGLHFFAVNQTVREAGHIPFSTFANRISGSEFGLILSVIGYVFLVYRKPAFILALPLLGIGAFALFGGLRFTVYAVPMAAMSAVYLLFVLGEYIKEIKARCLFIVATTGLLIYPNVTHIITYKVPTVFNKAEVQDLIALNEKSNAKDYTLAWWDYGYPIWFYSDTSTLIDGGKHDNDNYIISKIMFSTSQQQVANLARLAVETYVDSNYSIVANKLFKEQNPNELLQALQAEDYKLPTKTRDIYIYMPFRMLNIFPTVGVFGNLDLITGKKLHNISFYPAQPTQQTGSVIFLSNGISLDVTQGIVKLGKQSVPIRHFDVVVLDKMGNTKVQSTIFHQNGDLSVVYLKNYNKIIVMDNETYNSSYVQMFMLDHYDTNLFKKVVSSPYTKIFKLKI